MRKIVLSLAALAGLALLGGCTSWNNCSGNGFANKDYCTGTLHPNAGPYAAQHMM